MRHAGHAADVRHWRHVPDVATFQALGFYRCTVRAADGAFFDRIAPDPPNPASSTPARGRLSQLPDRLIPGKHARLECLGQLTS